MHSPWLRAVSSLEWSEWTYLFPSPCSRLPSSCPLGLGRKEGNNKPTVVFLITVKPLLAGLQKRNTFLVLLSDSDQSLTRLTTCFSENGPGDGWEKNWKLLKNLISHRLFPFISIHILKIWIPHFIFTIFPNWELPKGKQASFLVFILAYSLVWWIALSNINNIHELQKPEECEVHEKAYT